MTRELAVTPHVTQNLARRGSSGMRMHHPGTAGALGSDHSHRPHDLRAINHASALAQLRKVAEGLRPKSPKTATLLEEAAEEVLAYRHLPSEHHWQWHGTNPMKRLSREPLERRGRLSQSGKAHSLGRAVLLKQNDEWTVAERCHFRVGSMGRPTAPSLSTTTQETLAAIVNQPTG
jgi:hypothetical protein